MNSPRCSHRFRGPIFAIVLALLLAVSARAQLPFPPGTNLFGDDIVRKIPKVPGQPFGAASQPTEEEQQAARAKAEGYTQTLIFQNERQVRGEIVSLSKDEILWRRPDASAPIRFSRSEVRRIILAPDSPPPPKPQTASPAASPPKPIKATVKLTGADWLSGDLTSADAQTFTLKIDAKTSFTIPRAAIEWLYFDSRPAPAFGFSGNPSDFDGWLDFPPHPDIRMEGKTVSFQGGCLFGSMPGTPRLEVDWDLPADSEENTMLQLFPNADLGGFGTGQIDLSLGKSELRSEIYNDQLSSASATLPEASRSAPGPVTYRILYDNPGNRLIVFRNGWQALNLHLRKEDEDSNPDHAPNDHGIVSFSIQRPSEGAPHPVKLTRFRVAPWDGVIGQENQATPAGDRLISQTGAPLEGNLESVSGATLTFSGVETPIQRGLFVQLHGIPASFDGSASRLFFGRQGRLSVDAMQIEKGRARWRGAWAPALETPLEALQTISFPPSASPPPSDLLVFKDGDEFPGSLVALEPGGPILWQTSHGQTLEFQPERVGGVRFILGDDFPASGAPATLQLRNGDQVCAEVVSMDAKSLVLKRPFLGPLTLDRTRLWKLYPDPHAVEFGGARAAEALLGSYFEGRSEPLKEEPVAFPLIRLDGAQMYRAAGWNFYLRDGLPTPSAPNALDCYELSCDLTNPSGGSPDFDLQLYTKDRTSISFSYSQGMIRVYPRLQDRVHGRKRPIDDKVPASRINLRAFVNPKAGTADVFLNGIMVGQTGHTAAERIPGIGVRAGINSIWSSDSDLPQAFVLISNLWIGPWSGDFPKPGADPKLLLGNGDLVTGTVHGLTNGKLSIDSDLGPLEPLFAKIRCLDFGGESVPQPAAARIRLPDGSSLNVDNYRFAGRELTAHSASLGDLRLPAGALSELIINPSLPRPPPPLVTENPSPADTAQHPQK